MKWNTLKHNGLLFPKPYEPHRIPILYLGKEIILLPLEEEFATYYARLNPKYKNNPILNNNFWNDYKKILSNKSIQNLEDCNFDLIIERIISISKHSKDPIIELYQLKKEAMNYLDKQ